MLFGLAQLNVTVGDFQHNCRLIVESIDKARADGVDVLVFSEQVVCGYPAEDLVLRDDFMRAVNKAMVFIEQHSHGLAVVVGHPQRDGDKLFNAATVFAEGKMVCSYRKQRLPNYLVFDEHRYFAEGDETCVFEYKSTKIGVLICEDLWHKEPIAQCKANGAEIIVSPNGSPWHRKQTEERGAMLKARSEETGLTIIYVNQVGGQDELIFDGRSQVWSNGSCLIRAKCFEPDYLTYSLSSGVHSNALPIAVTGPEETYRAITLSIRDYVKKNGFKGVILGLSGGIDSALTLALAVDALGADQVKAVMMPYRYTADMSIEDARAQANTLSCAFECIDIAPMVDAFMNTLSPHFEGTRVDVTEQNLQARCRGTTLMALSNKFGYLVLTTGNKSEMGVGYATLYGDMAGGFDVLKDVPKMWVYELSKWRNRDGVVIPTRVIERAPSAELAPDQKDEDNLPAYPILDAILEAYIEKDLGIEEIVEMGFDKETVKRVMQLVDRNEYKRRQSAPGPRTTKRAFGRDRRYPITSGFIRQPDDWR